MAKKGPMGKGLGALIDTSYEKKSVDDAKSSGAVAEIKISQIHANRNQPRKEFDEEALQELADSIKQLGVIQPITVRKVHSKKFEIISGERRYRAAKKAGLRTIISFVRDADDDEMLQMALVENIQREDLNAMEVSITYQRLMEECNFTQDDLSERVGKKRSTITNYLRLLKLPPDIQAGVTENRIGMGHAKALVTIEDAEVQMDTFYKVISEGLSVRETEKLIRAINYPVKPEKKKKSRNELPDEFKKFKNEIADYFPGKVNIKRNNAGRGSVSLSFTSDKQFAEIKKLLSKLK
ncbi:MAG: ParB/RepB/Spo0J family partition protein [Bacteroidota bacterium]|nr:ParB/RepB/Spo0J family partition protein [Bacteroidota bacterium]